MLLSRMLNCRSLAFFKATVNTQNNKWSLTLHCFPCGSADKESTCNARDLCSILGLGGSPGEGKCYLLQYSGLKNSMDCIVHCVIESDMTE